MITVMRHAGMAVLWYAFLGALTLDWKAAVFFATAILFIEMNKEEE